MVSYWVLAKTQAVLELEKKICTINQFSTSSIKTHIRKAPKRASLKFSTYSTYFVSLLFFPFTCFSLSLCFNFTIISLTLVQVVSLRIQSNKIYKLKQLNHRPVLKRNIGDSSKPHQMGKPKKWNYVQKVTRNLKRTNKQHLGRPLNQQKQVYSPNSWGLINLEGFVTQVL